MNTRIMLCMAAAICWAAMRFVPSIPLSPPAVTPAAAPFPELAASAAKLPKEERAALSDAYAVLSRAVAADPADDPVFIDTPAVRRAHRAAMLFVWKGVLANKTGEVPGLQAELEGAVAKRIGTDEVPMNPTLKAEAAKAFGDISLSVK